MVKIKNIFNFFYPVNVLIAGDFVVDEYTIGKINRISPEAPVPIFSVEGGKKNPGCAGNVVTNFISLEAKVIALGRIGDDLNGKYLKKYLKNLNVNVDFLFTQKKYITSIKNRLIVDNQQIIRIDNEELIDVSDEIENEILKNLDAIIKKVDVVAISDYNKGFLSKNILKGLITTANKYNIPIIVDPKGDDYLKYFGATIIKPNLKEAYIGANVSNEAKKVSLKEVASIILNKTNIQHLLITMSENGIAVFNKELKEKKILLTNKREIKDVTGAGDTVLTIVAIALANKLDIYNACKIANIAAGIVIEKMGSMGLSLEELLRKLLKVDSNNNILDKYHFFILNKIFKKKKFILLQIEEENFSLQELFQCIQNIYLENKKIEIIIFFKQSSTVKKYLLQFLTSLKEVSFIIFSDDLKNLKLNPLKIYNFKTEKLELIGNKL